MNRENFEKLFLKSIHDAIAKASRLAERELPSDFEIELHGGGVGGKIVTVGQALDRMFISGELFNPIIDIGLKEVRGGRCLIFVRVSPQSPTSFEKTWNTPKGNGPFKIIEPTKVTFAN